MTLTLGPDAAIWRVASVLPLFTTMISARQRVREISAIIAVRHDSIRASSLYAGTTKLTNTSSGIFRSPKSGSDGCPPRARTDSPVVALVPRSTSLDKVFGERRPTGSAAMGKANHRRGRDAC